MNLKCLRTDQVIFASLTQFGEPVESAEVKRDGSRWKGNVRLLSTRGNVSGSGIVGFFLVLGVISLHFVILGAFPPSSKCQRLDVVVHKHTACAGSSKTERLFILTSTSGTSK